MSLLRLPLALTALALRFYRTRPSRRSPADPRILVIRRNRLGDMLCTLPLLRLIRRHYGQAHLTVACDPPGAEVARACEAVDEVIVLETGWDGAPAFFRNARRLQDFDWVVVAKGGFDRRLAGLARLTNAAVRVGFSPERVSPYFTDTIELAEIPQLEHQTETILRLGSGLGINRPVFEAEALRLEIPTEARAFADAAVADSPLARSPRFALVNLSSTARLRFRAEDFETLIARLLSETDLAIGLVFAPRDRETALALAMRLNSPRVGAIATPGPLELGALLERAAFFTTPEGGAAHLAAAVATPTVVLWSEGPFEKWHSRGPGQVFVRLGPKEKWLTVAQVWAALEPALALAAR
jgi:ADP-heptose:LPS heptosyltransferase